MLVTISGVVGAGKSTAEDRIRAVLQSEGIPVDSWRFRTLPCFSLPFSRPRQASKAAPPEPEIRGRGYRRKTLTLAATVGYLGRMAAFRLYRRRHRSSSWVICNRYFYDNLAHFELDTRWARRYVALLRQCMPKPDLAILLVASPGTIAERRPQYTAEYLDRVGHAYREMRAVFPELVVLNSDHGHGALESLERLVRGRIANRQ